MVIMSSFATRGSPCAMAQHAASDSGAAANGARTTAGLTIEEVIEEVLLIEVLDSVASLAYWAAWSRA